MEYLDRSADAFNAWSTLMHQLGSMPTVTSRAASHAAYYRGWALRGMGASEQSVEFFTKAMEMYESSLSGREPTQGDAYNLACYAALAGESDRAIALWEQALETGYRDDGSWWRMDPDLDPIRADERFRAIAREYRLVE
jgi:tetratricopeptide (TPR) repeat protein